MLSEAVRAPIARSLAVFQLRESSGGTRLKRYAKVIAEEQSHAALLGRLIAHLKQPPLKKQWTNSIFRWTETS